MLKIYEIVEVNWDRCKIHKVGNLINRISKLILLFGSNVTGLKFAAGFIKGEVTYKGLYSGCISLCEFESMLRKTATKCSEGDQISIT